MNKTQKRILEYLADGERFSFQIAEAVKAWPWQMPIYWHLGELEEKGLIARRKTHVNAFPHNISVHVYSLATWRLR